MTRGQWLPLGALLLALAAPVAADRDAAEIEYLLDFVAASDCDFERNGEVHSAADAAGHLRLKYRRGARHAATAEQFIDRLASKSSWTGKQYRVTCGGVTEPSGTWLHRALQDYRREQSSG